MLCLFLVAIGCVCLDRIAVDILPAYETPAVQVLNINESSRVMLRENLLFEGRFPAEE